MTLKWHFLPLRAVVEFLGYTVVTFIPHQKVRHVNFLWAHIWFFILHIKSEQRKKLIYKIQWCFTRVHFFPTIHSVAPLTVRSWKTEPDTKLSLFLNPRAVVYSSFPSMASLWYIPFLLYTKRHLHILCAVPCLFSHAHLFMSYEPSLAPVSHNQLAPLTSHWPMVCT